MNNQELITLSPSQTQLLKHSDQLPGWIKSKRELDFFNAQYEKKIKDFDELDLIQLVEFVAQWRIELGVTTEMLEAELKNNTAFIQDSFPDMSIKTLILAKNLAFGAVLGVSATCFNNFSPLYIGSILNAFNLYQQKELGRILKEKHVYENGPKEPTPEEQINRICDYYETFSMSVIEQDGPVHGSALLWNFCINNGYIKAEEIDDSDIAKAASALSSSHTILSKINIHSDLSEFTKKCRFLVMKRYFIKNKIDFRSLSPDKLFNNKAL